MIEIRAVTQIPHVVHSEQYTVPDMKYFKNLSNVSNTVSIVYL